MHPIQIENAVDLPNQMIRRIIDRSRESPPDATESRLNRSLNESFATQSSESARNAAVPRIDALCQQTDSLASNRLLCSLE